MKILLITKLYPSYPGQSRKEMTYALHYFVRDWIQQGYEVRVVKISPVYPRLISKLISNKNDQLTGSVEIDGVKVNRYTITKVPKIDYLKKHLQNLCEEVLSDINDKPNIVLCHGFNPGLYIGNEIKDKFNVPLILTMHKTDVNNILDIPKRKEKFRKLIGNVDQIGFRSEALYNKYQKTNIRKNEGFIIPSGINSELIISQNDKENLIEKNDITIFTAAKMVKDKNIEVLVKAFGNCIKIHPKIKLKIAGDGPEKKSIIDLINKYELNKNIELLGYLSREEVLSEMEKSQIFAMVSSNETFGLVYLEAMAKGCITIGSKNEGIDGIIQNEYNGFLCVPEDVKDLEKTILKIIYMNIEERNKIIRRSLETSRKYSQVKISERYVEILRDYC